ncbi:MAG TPA: hypothetical protein VMT34_11140 [Aggregatilineales bacterium]|jgi:hypothetical protein|nr:hypothetical protein [Aggregatilineales bacterium]
MPVRVLIVTGSEARLDWSEDVVEYSLDIRADATPGHYIVALGYAGAAELP